MFSPYTFLGMDRTVIFELDSVGKYLTSASKVPEAAVDCKELSKLELLDKNDPVKKLE
jgi:hypothetical protein